MFNLHEKSEISFETDINQISFFTAFTFSEASFSLKDKESFSKPILVINYKQSLNSLGAHYA